MGIPGSAGELDDVDRIAEQVERGTARRRSRGGAQAKVRVCTANTAGAAAVLTKVTTDPMPHFLRSRQ